MYGTKSPHLCEAFLVVQRKDDKDEKITMCRDSSSDYETGTYIFYDVEKVLRDNEVV